MKNRQKIVLSLIHEHGGSIEKLRLMKLAFLYSQSNHVNPDSTFYKFVPYKYGPFSFSMYHEIAQMINLDLLYEINDEISVNPKKDSEFAHDYEVKREINSLYKKFRRVRTPDLIDFVYNLYPWYTMNSVLLNKSEVQRIIAPIKLYTIGYEGKDIDSFLNILLQTGIRKIIDIRNNPISRVYGYHQSTLARLLDNLDISYSGFPDFGIKSSDRKNLSTTQDYLFLFHQYYERAATLDTSNLINLITSTPSALLCQEADPYLCHRSYLAKLLNAQTGLEVKHL